MHEKLETRTFLLFLFFVSVGFILLLKPFFGVIFWACAIAIIFAPIQNRFLTRWPDSPNKSAFATLAICILVVILPVVIVLSSVISEGVVFYDKLQSGEISPARYIDSMHTAFPALNNLLSTLGFDIENLKNDAINAAMSSGKFIAGHTLKIGQNAFGFIVNLALMLYIAFFMLRDGNYLVDLLVRAATLSVLYARF
jgi:predicted PurR-regulated permease PerM